MVKYEVGDWVTLVGIQEEHKFAISEITEHTCSAGTQTMYLGRLYSKGGETTHITTRIQVAEMEIKEKIRVS